MEAYATIYLDGLSVTYIGGSQIYPEGCSSTFESLLAGNNKNNACALQQMYVLFNSMPV